MEDNAPPPPPVAGQQATSVIAPTSLAKPAPPPGPAFPVREDKPVATWPEVGFLLAAGFFGNLALRSSIATVTAALCAALVIGAMVLSRRILRREALLLLGLAAALVPWLFIRANVALTTVTSIMIGTLLIIAAGVSLSGSVFDTKVRELLAHVVSFPSEWFYGTSMVQRLVKVATADQKVTPLLRGIAVAVPVLIVFTTLLASADEVFARVLLIGNLPSLVGHLIVTAIVAIALVAFVSRSAHQTPTSSNPLDLRWLGPVEIAMILGSLVMLFGAFVITQIVVAAGGANVVLETEGLTQADHARRGFFQLLWVAGLAVALVGGLRAVRVTDPERGTDRFTPLALVTLLLTLIIGGISLQRLSLYVGSFGFTPLRLWAMVGAGAVMVAVALFAASVAGWRSGHSWFPGAMLLLAAGVVFGLNLANPDAMVADYNLSNQTGLALDKGTLVNLSDDAVPTIIESLGQLDGAERNDLVASLCSTFDRQTTYGPLEYNRSAVSADRTLDDLCGARQVGSSDRGRD